MNSNKVLPVLVTCITLLSLVSCNLPTREADPPVVEEIASDDESRVEVPTSLPPAARADSCLINEWWMDTGTLDLLVATLVPMPGIRVPSGDATFTFTSGGNYYYAGSLVIRIDMTADQYMEGEGTFNTEGTYTTDGGIITFSESEGQNNIMEWRAYAHGQSAEVPGGGPSFSLIPAGAAPYRCSDDILEIDTQGPAGTVTMFFDRNP